MSCNLTDEDRRNGVRCRSWDCQGCKKFSCKTDAGIPAREPVVDTACPVSNMKKCPNPTNETDCSNWGFDRALRHLKESRHSGQYQVTREGWPRRPAVRLQLPDENSKMTEPYLYMSKRGTDGKQVIFPLDLSCESVLANDWMMVI